jgi:hypothetical protein
MKFLDLDDLRSELATTAGAVHAVDLTSTWLWRTR